LTLVPFKQHFVDKYILCWYSWCEIFNIWPF